MISEDVPVGTIAAEATPDVLVVADSLSTGGDRGRPRTSDRTRIRYLTPPGFVSPEPLNLTTIVVAARCCAYLPFKRAVMTKVT